MTTHFCEVRSCSPRCKTQSGNNLIPSGGFNSASGWTPIVSDGTAWDTLDRYNCPTSGSLILGKMGANSDCIRVTAFTSYYFGFSYLGPGPFANPICGISWYHASDCNVDSYFDGTGAAAGGRGIDWQSASGNLFAPENALGAIIKCYDFGASNNDGKWTHIDLMYMNATSPDF